MSPLKSPAAQAVTRRAKQAAGVIIVSSVMFSFISYWRTAAVVLCDMSSTSYYIGGLVEQAIGPAAPWFILAVLLFSYAVRLVYIESCSLFVRGGVYRVVKNAMGSTLGKLAVSALMFDYILTGPISSVSAGQYIMNFLLDLLAYTNPNWAIPDGPMRLSIRSWGSVLLACATTIYFYRLNVIGIHESSDKALKIMIATTVMGVIMFVWCGVTLRVQGPKNSVPFAPNLEKKFDHDVTQGVILPKLNPITGEQEDPLGFLDRLLPEAAIEHLRRPGNWLSLIGVMGLFLAFGHSILAMSGEETLAQVYREVESPKLVNFQKAAFIVFLYSLILTGGISFLAVLLIPNDVRMKLYSDNLIGGLAMNVIGPEWARLALNGFVCLVGFLILSGAVNTAIIGSNGVLNRMAEDGVLADWFLKPHSHYGTSYRLLRLIVGLQLLTILVSGGNTYLLGEAYAFGVVWSFVFQALSMLVLRFRDPRPREYKVPLNITIGNIEFPIGLGLVFLVLVITAIGNFFTKEIATVGGIAFTGMFMTIFTVSERYNEKKRLGVKHEHLEQFNQESSAEINPVCLDLHLPYRKLVSIRSPQNLFMLEQALAETDPETTDVVVMTAKLAPADGSVVDRQQLDSYDQHLMTAVVEKAEQAGKRVVPLIVPTNNPLHAILRMARDLNVQELVIGASNKFTADEQLEQVAFYWISLHPGKSAPLTVRILSRNRDVYFDLEGGCRIPKISERQARSVAELRAAGLGVDRLLLGHDGTQASSDLFQEVLTMLDPQVALSLVTVPTQDGTFVMEGGTLHPDAERARQLEREIQVHEIGHNWDSGILKVLDEGKYDLLILALSPNGGITTGWPGHGWVEHILKQARCPVFLATLPAIPRSTDD